MTKIAIETKSEIIKTGLQNILKEYEVLDFYKLKDEDYSLLIFQNKDLARIKKDKIRIIKKEELPLNIDYSVITIFAKEEEILEAVNKTIRGYIHIEESLKEIKRDRTKKFENLKKLTKREKFLLEEIISGKTNKEISKEVYISEKTVKNNLTILYKKLEVSGRQELLKKYDEKLNKSSL